jgi:hypothetical protein
MKLIKQYAMLLRNSFLLTVFVFSTAINAEEKQPIDLDDPKPLIMQPGYHLKNGYADENKTTSDAFKTNGDSGDDLTGHCSALLDSAAKLKRQGKFQQHWAATERYKYECQAVFDRSPD